MNDGKSMDAAPKRSFQDFIRKVVIVLNKQLESWQTMNAVAHIAVYIGNKMKATFDTGNNFVTQYRENHPRNLQYPIIVLAAKSGQMRNLMKKVRASGLLYHGFIREMVETTDDEEITQILGGKLDKSVEYLGIGVCGKNVAVDALTKKFGLWK